MEASTGCHPHGICFLGLLSFCWLRGVNIATKQGAGGLGRGAGASSLNPLGTPSLSEKTDVSRLRSRALLERRTWLG